MILQKLYFFEIILKNIFSEFKKNQNFALKNSKKSMSFHKRKFFIKNLKIFLKN